eukprot:442886_1
MEDTETAIELGNNEEEQNESLQKARQSEDDEPQAQETAEDGRVEVVTAQPEQKGDIPLQRRESFGVEDVAMDETQEVSSICFNCTYPGCFNWCCKDYRIRVYVHYWIWQVLMLCLNIALIVLYAQDVQDRQYYHRPGGYYSYYYQESEPRINTKFLSVLFIFCAILVRDKQFSWLLYGFVKRSKYYTCSQRCRYHITRLADGIGGLHSSFGVSALIWNAIFFFDSYWWIRSLNFNVSLLLPFSLLIMVIFALPCVREHYHNTFELTHRYFRWLMIVVLIYTNFTVEYRYNRTLAGLVLMFLIVLLTVYPWLIQHKISGADVTVVSASMATAYFFPIKCPMGAVAKISTNGLEYHVMGITPLGTDEKTGKPKSLALIKSLGDWTTKLNDDTRDEAKLRDMTFYIARVKPPNFTQGLFNWDRVFILVTGVGIAPCIPYVTNDISGLGLAVSLLWVARDHANNYPKFIIDILEPIPNMELYDTTKKKRPNLCSLVVKKARAFDAQAVFIVSGADMASRVGNFVHAQGIPVFASNFDT